MYKYKTTSSGDNGLTKWLHEKKKVASQVLERRVPIYDDKIDCCSDSTFIFRLHVLKFVLLVDCSQILTTNF